MPAGGVTKRITAGLIPIMSFYIHDSAKRIASSHFSQILNRRAQSRAYTVCIVGRASRRWPLFVVDEEGMIRWSYCSPVGVNPGAEGILQTLEELDR